MIFFVNLDYIFFQTEALSNQGWKNTGDIIIICGLSKYM